MSLPVVNLDMTDKEVKAVTEVVKSKYLIEGKNAREFENKFCDFTGAKYCSTVINGTQALHLGLTALNIGPKDEVITTPFTFIASSNAILFTGAIPIFVDVKRDTFNIDPEQIESAITDKTKAIMPVHIFGNPCEMDAIRDIADDNNLLIIEDCAQSHDARIDGTHTGNFGDLGCFSFYGTKNLIAGEGGAIICNDEDLFEKIKSIKNHGRNPKGGYNHYRIGYNYRMTDMQAAIMNVQMDRAEEILQKRHRNGSIYREEFKNVEELLIQNILPGHSHSDYLFAPVIEKEGIKTEDIIEHLKSNDIGSRTIYSILSYQQPCYQDLSNWPLSRVIDYPDYSKVDCPNAEFLAKNHFEIPMVTSLNEEDIHYVSNVLIDYLKGH